MIQPTVQFIKKGDYLALAHSVSKYHYGHTVCGLADLFKKYITAREFDEFCYF